MRFFVGGVDSFSYLLPVSRPSWLVRWVGFVSCCGSCSGLSPFLHSFSKNGRRDSTPPHICLYEILIVFLYQAQKTGSENVRISHIYAVFLCSSGVKPRPPFFRCFAGARPLFFRCLGVARPPFFRCLVRQWYVFECVFSYRFAGLWCPAFPLVFRLSSLTLSLFFSYVFFVCL